MPSGVKVSTYLFERYSESASLSLASNIIMGKFNYEEILKDSNLYKAIQNNTTMSGIMRDLNIPIKGNNIKTLRAILLKNNINLDNITGIPRREDRKRASEYFLENSTIKGYKIKLKLLKEGIKENKCEICGITSWQGKPINMQIHHIDGNSANNRLENLILLCPNCHSQTDNYCGSANKKEKEIYHCPKCGREKKTSKGLCVLCSSLNRRKVNKPSKNELLELIRKYKTNTKISVIYNISDTVVRRWRKEYCI